MVPRHFSGSALITDLIHAESDRQASEVFGDWLSFLARLEKHVG